MKLISDELPKKGEDIIGYDKDGMEFYCFRCNCNSESCTDIRDSITGGLLLVEIIKWEYEK